MEISYVAVKGMLMSPLLIGGEPVKGYFICIGPNHWGFKTKEQAEQALAILKLNRESANSG